MKKILFIFLLMFSFNVKAMTAEEQLNEFEEVLSDYHFDFKYVNLDDNVKLIDEIRDDWYDEQRIKSWFFNGLMRSDIENLINLSSNNAIDIACHLKGDTYQRYDGEKTVDEIAQEDFCSIQIYYITGEGGISVDVTGSFTEVEGNEEIKNKALTIVKELSSNVYIGDVDMFNHYLNYASDTSTFFEGNNAINEFANLKKLVEDNPEYNFFVGFEDTRRGDSYMSAADGLTYLEKDGVIYGFGLSTYNCTNMFFVPTGTKREDYGKVLEERLKKYVNDDNVKIEVLPYDETKDNFFSRPDANVSGNLLNLLGITIDEYYTLVNSDIEKEISKLTNNNDIEACKNSKKCVAMYSYQLFIDGARYEIGISELDQNNISKFGDVVSLDKKSGIIIKTESGNVPLDASLLVDKYELSNEELEYLNNLGYKNLLSYNFKLYSKILDKLIHTFNNASEILIPLNDLKKDVQNLRIIYLDDDKNHEVFEVKKVVYSDQEYLSFSTNHFSNYVLVENVISNPNTGDNIFINVIMFFISIIGLCSCFWYKKGLK